MSQGAEDLNTRWAWGGSRQVVEPPAQAGGDEKLLMDIAILMHNWRAGRYKDVYVMSRLSQMFPDPPSVARR